MYIVKNKQIRKMDTKFAYKNLLVVSTAFLLLFAAFEALQTLQSSIHADPSVGFLNLCIIYASCTVSCVIVPPIVLAKLGYKYSILLSMFGYVLYTAVQFYPALWLMVLCSIVLGICAAILWSSKASYVNTLAIKYAEWSHQQADTVISKFMSISYFILAIGLLLGNILSSSVLTRKSSAFNTTNSNQCGARFCPSNIKEVITGQAEPETVYTLLSIYLVFGVLALLTVFLFLSQLDRYKQEGKLSQFSRVTSTLRLMKKRDTLLILPLTVYSGLFQGFIYGDITKAYVTCSIGIESIGYVMMFMSAFACVASFTTTIISKWVSAFNLVRGVNILNLFLLIWTLFLDVKVMGTGFLYMTSSFCGIIFIIHRTQITTVYGVFFPNNQDEAFGILKMLRSIGYVISFSYGNHLCTNVKIFILIGLLIVAFVLFEVALHNRKPWVGFSTSYEEGEREELIEKEKKLDVGSSKTYV